MTGLWLGNLLAMVLLFGLTIATLRWVGKQSTPPSPPAPVPTGAPAAAATASATAVTATPLWRAKYFGMPVWGIILTIVTAAVLLYAFSYLVPVSGTMTYKHGNINWWFAALFLVVLVVASLVGKAGLAGIMVLIILAVLSGDQVFFEGELRKSLVNLMKTERVVLTEKKEMVPREVAVVRARVAHQDFTVSPGTTALYKKHRCYVDNLTKQEMQHVVRFEKGDHVLFVSNHPGTIQARIWFFDEGGYCIEDFAKLRAQQAFQ